MKKFISVLLILALSVGFFGCGKKVKEDETLFSTEVITSSGTTKEPESSAKTEESSESDESGKPEESGEKPSETTTEKPTENSSETTAPTVPTTDESTPQISPMDSNKHSGTVLYGKRTGTKATYTGLEPLKSVTLPVVDPNNLRGFSNTANNHSFGVSTGGKPHEISVDKQKFYDKYGGFCLDTSGKKVIYLTFDCGYENGCTGKILDTLKEKNVPAAFFVTLSHVKSNPELIARMINEGHIVGNHSTTHPNFTTISRTKMVEEIQTLDNYLREKFGYSALFFRFPEGACSENSLELIQSIGFKSVFWSTAYADWDTNNQKGAEYAFNTVTSRLHPGCVLLLHAVSYDNAEALGDIIDYAVSQGYTFKALSEYK